jgi:VCBS repeat-containing protein
VSITINSTPNSAPTAQPDQYGATKNMPLNIAAAGGVLANDFDADGDTLVALLAISALHGNLVLNANGSFAYTPAPGFTGSDSFSYRATDGKATSAVVAVAITVSASKNSPADAARCYLAVENVPLEFQPWRRPRQRF